MKTLSEPNDVREVIRESYARIVTERTAPQAASTGACCTPEHAGGTPADQLGYSAHETEGVPAGADLGLGCGNPQAIASLQPGETVLDLGSGAGFDCFLAARAVGSSGRVIGVDMTPQMIAKARANAAKAGTTNVEFRLGEIEALPVADESVDVILSNCVINLSPEKPRVFREAFRVLKPGGRLAIADIVRTAELPASLANDQDALCGCVSGAASIEALESMLRDAGFVDVRIRPKEASREFIRHWVEGANAADYIVSSTMEAVKPSDSCCGPVCCA